MPEQVTSLINIELAGEIRSSVFSYDEITATSGTLGVYKSAGTLKYDITTISGSFLLPIEPPGSGLPLAPFFWSRGYTTNKKSHSR